MATTRAASTRSRHRRMITQRLPLEASANAPTVPAATTQAHVGRLRTAGARPPKRHGLPQAAYCTLQQAFALANGIYVRANS